MGGSWPYFLLSLVSLVAGFVLVLLFTHLFVIPSMHNKPTMLTQCYVEDVLLMDLNKQTPTNSPDIKSYKTGSNDWFTVSLGQSSVDTDPPSVRNHSDDEGYQCWTVIVSFQMADGHYRRGYLYQRATSLAELAAITSTTQKCFCPKCPLANPSSSLTPSVAAGDTVKCHYMLPNVQPAAMSGLALLNVMLWPTVLFVAGFVGLFFACICLAEEDWKCGSHSLPWSTQP